MAPWTNPLTRLRCGSKAPYRSMRAAEAKAERASMRAGELIIAYECPDCGRFHIGHADLSQRLAHKVRVPRCRVCDEPIPEHRLLGITRRRHTTAATPARSVPARSGRPKMPGRARESSKHESHLHPSRPVDRQRRHAVS